jgi:hypothetical protein
MGGGWKRNEDGTLHRSRWWRLVENFKRTTLRQVLDTTHGVWAEAGRLLELDLTQIQNIARGLDRQSGAPYELMVYARELRAEAQAHSRKGRKAS